MTNEIEILELFELNPNGLDSSEIKNKLGDDGFEIVKLLISNKFIHFKSSRHYISTLGTERLKSNRISTKVESEKIKRELDSIGIAKKSMYYSLIAIVVAVIALLYAVLHDTICNGAN